VREAVIIASLFFAFNANNIEPWIFQLATKPIRNLSIWYSSVMTHTCKIMIIIRHLCIAVAFSILIYVNCAIVSCQNCYGNHLCQLSMYDGGINRSTHWARIIICNQDQIIGDRYVFLIPNSNRLKFYCTKNRFF